MSREPVRDLYDAAVGLFPTKKAPLFAYALVKFTCTIEEGRLVLAPPVPLLHDIHDPETSPRILPGTDFWLDKQASDVVFIGSAFASRPLSNMRVSVAVGRASKHIEVWGRRVVTWQGNSPRFSSPEPFEEMPITNANAYGGYDGRVPTPEVDSIVSGMRQEFDHPGVYPRNPFGKGYLVVPSPVEHDIELPNLEDPDDLLTPDRLIVGDPRMWYRQPLPWSLDWHHPMMFPRYVYVGADAWFHGPQDRSMPEVARGYIVENYRDQFHEGITSGQECPPAFFQDASLGMVFPQLETGTPISVSGMHRDGKTLAFSIPKPPRIVMTIENKVENVRPVLSTVAVLPAEKKVCFTYLAKLTDLPRVFIPGIHGKIPLSIQVNKDQPIVYETPPTIRDQLQAIQKAKH